jgi:UDP-N-acetylglucosamine 2-epimerase
MGGLVEQILQRARNKYGDKAWSTQIVKLLEDDLNSYSFHRKLFPTVPATLIE